MQSLESEINFLRSELQEENALVKSLVTFMLHIKMLKRIHY